MDFVMILNDTIDHASNWINILSSWLAGKESFMKSRNFELTAGDLNAGNAHYFRPKKVKLGSINFVRRRSKLAAVCQERPESLP